MTRVDFYVLPEQSGESAAVTASKLCDKANTAGQRVYVFASEVAQQDELSRLLWTLRQGSFLAHERYAGAKLDEPLPAVLLGSAEPPASHHQILINLGAEVPAFFSRFERVLEVVSGDAAQRGKSRERFKFYRDRGYELKTINL